MKNVTKLNLFATIAFAIAALVLTTTQSINAQDDVSSFNKSAVAESGANASDFAPKGWKVEEEIKGDLNADGKADLLIKLIEDKPKKGDEMVNRYRALVVALADSNGEYKRAAVNGNLLQCTGCGGAFYGVLDAPADVSIEKGVIVASDESGSRWVSTTTYKFRFNAKSGKFLLIGFDYASRDRAAGDVSSESTNYVTSKRITEIGKGKRSTKKTTVIKKENISLDDIDTETFEMKVLKRLGLD